MIIASGFSWFHLLPMGEDAAVFDGHGFMLFSAFFVCLLVIGFSLIARRQLEAALAKPGLERYHADESLSARNVAELTVGFLADLMGDLMEKDDVRRYIPLISTLFVYILVCNLLAIVPGFQPPTDNINTNIGMAIVVLITYWAVGLTRNAKGFTGHIVGPVMALAPLMVVIELIGLLLVRPGSLSVRLTGNIFGDHTVFNIMSGLVPLFVPVLFLMLAILVSLIQAFVFSLLTTIYISQSLPHGDHDDH